MNTKRTRAWIRWATLAAVLGCTPACTDRVDVSRLPAPAVLPETFPGRLPNSATFLRDGGRTRIMNLLSEEMPENEFRRQVDACVASRDDTIALYVTNRGDGQPPVTSFYRDDEYGGEVDEASVALMRERIEYCRSRPLRVHLWIWSDDSGFGAVPDSVNVAHLARSVELFDDLVDAWCVGLELDEVFGTAERVSALTHELETRTERPVGVHFTALDRWDWAVDSGADLWFGQYGFGLSPEKIHRLTEQTIVRLDGRIGFWAFEYHLSSTSADAKALGDAAISVPGCLGTGNGRTRRDAVTS